uniref:Uncharacterized protein n=1 Tax=Chromera velia CCMP2878 TaxID=1169474 RepID=A0A0G4I5H7_9ALVE|eukprot:Cvel_11173.t1-p1 / transcript=Cvel_11173.t1 / gene=Cvel_11173 / organism=Chromera_velia_CCMP2878 / gene_product=hypothetical protein / transcript_product=hypothetical protein / location=Cvel_scaffold693:44105-45403(-) / protein_length=322 / sequence_SO=supercontig / SO=protein_coding / is_pseudo=false
MKFAALLSLALVGGARAYTETPCEDCVEWVKADQELYPTFEHALTVCCYQCNNYSDLTYQQGCSSTLDSVGNVVHDMDAYMMAKFLGEPYVEPLVIPPRRTFQLVGHHVIPVEIGENIVANQVTEEGKGEETEEVLVDAQEEASEPAVEAAVVKTEEEEVPAVVPSETEEAVAEGEEVAQEVTEEGVAQGEEEKTEKLPRVREDGSITYEFEFAPGEADMVVDLDTYLMKEEAEQQAETEEAETADEATEESDAVVEETEEEEPMEMTFGMTDDFAAPVMAEPEETDYVEAVMAAEPEEVVMAEVEKVMPEEVMPEEVAPQV